MAYQISGLDPVAFAEFKAVVARRAVRVVADKGHAFPYLRAFDRAGIIRTAALAARGDADAGVRTMLADDGVDHVDIDAAARDCFLVRVERDDA